MLNRSRQKRDIEKNKVPRQLVTHTHKHLKCICWIELDRNGTKKKILSLGFHASFLPLDRNDDSRKNIVPRQKFLFTLTHDLLAPPTLRLFPLRSKKLRWLAIKWMIFELGKNPNTSKGILQNKAKLLNTTRTSNKKCCFCCTCYTIQTSTYRTSRATSPTKKTPDNYFK